MAPPFFLAITPTSLSRVRGAAGDRRVPVAPGAKNRRQTEGLSEYRP
jgi:hypothetical protein